jgi:hypothetical protein
MGDEWHKETRRKDGEVEMGRINGGGGTRLQYSRFSQDFHIPEAERSPKMPILILTLQGKHTFYLHH